MLNDLINQGAVINENLSSNPSCISWLLGGHIEGLYIDQMLDFCSHQQYMYVQRNNGR